jgi:hypothetical protein
MGVFRDFFTSLWNSAIRDPIREVRDKLNSELVRPLADKLAELKTSVETIPAKIGEVPAAIREIKDKITAVTPDWLESVLGGILDFGYRMTVGHKIDMLKAIKDGDALEAAWLALPTPFRNLQEVAEVYKARKAELTGDWKLSPFASIAESLYEGFGELADTAEDAVADIIETVLPSSSPKLVEAFDPTLDRVIGMLFTAMSGMGKKLDPELQKKVTDTLRPMLRMIMIFEVGSWLAEWISPMKNSNIRTVSHALYDTVGFRQLTEAYIDPIRLNLITQPVKYSINELTQPFLPTPGELSGLARKYEITKEKYETAMRMQGIQEDYVQALYSGFWADPRLFEILRLMEVELPPVTPDPEAKKWLEKGPLKGYVGPDWWLAMKFGKAGYDMIDIPVLIKVVRARNLMKELGDIRTLNRNIYKDGGMTRAEYEKTLESRGISKTESKEVIDAIDREIQADINVEYRRADEKKYLYGRIDLEQLKIDLVTHGLTKARAEARAEYLLEVKTGKMPAEGDIKDLTKAEVLRSYRLGKLEKGGALQRIDNQGYTVEDAALLVDTEEQSLIDDEDDEFIRAYEQRCLYGRMSVEELKKKYVDHGKSERWAEGRAAYMAERVFGKEETEEEIAET